jgi:hypothetical protein
MNFILSDLIKEEYILDSTPLKYDVFKLQKDLQLQPSVLPEPQNLMFSQN